MLKKNNYFIMLAYFIFMFVIYQFLSLGFGWDDTRAVNHADISGDRKNEAEPVVTEPRQWSGEQFILAADQKDTVFATVEEWLSLIQADYIWLERLPELSAADQQPDTVFIATADVDAIGGVRSVKTMLEAGVNVIFCTMPDQAAEAYGELAEMMGIVSTGQEYEQTGIRIGEGILLGGAYQSEELTVHTRAVVLNGTARIYAGGYEKDGTTDDTAPLIWRSRYGAGSLFVINGDFLEKKAGMGILAGVYAQKDNTVAYPVVAAKVVMLDNFPLLSAENNEKFVEVFNREQHTFTRDVIWSSLLSSMKSLDIVYSCYMTLGFEPETVENGMIDRESLSFFAKEFYRSGSEMAIGNPFKDTAADQTTVSATVKAIRSELPNYEFYSAVTGETKLNVDGLILTGIPQNYTDNEEDTIFAALTEDTVRIPVTIEGRTLNEEQLFDNRCLASALCYIGYRIDFQPVFQDLTNDADYQELNREMEKSLSAVTQPYSKLPALTVTETASRIKAYRNTQMDITVNGDTVIIETDSDEISYALLRTDQEITNITGADYSWLEKGYMLIEVQGKYAEIYLG